MTIKKNTVKNRKKIMGYVAGSSAVVCTTAVMLIFANRINVSGEGYTYCVPEAEIMAEPAVHFEELQENVLPEGVSIEAKIVPDVATAANGQVLAYIEKNYTNLGIANVNTSLNVRISPVNGKVIGRIPAGGACEVLETADGWFKIKSGDVEGYVSAEYLLTGDLAIERAMSELTETATVNVSGLNMRKSASISSEVITVLRRNTVVDVLKDCGEWLKISYNNMTGYVYSEYTESGFRLAEALSTETKKYGTEISDLRERVVAYAKQFVGNPYVYGGNSLTQGTDCSGFVKLIMAHFGITTPRTATTQYNAGRKISVAELLPGDLIVYGDKQIEHIAIYIGDGQVVHASNAKTGIKYSKYNYRNIYGCVRFIEN